MSEWRKRDIVTRSSDYYCINDPRALAQEMEVRQLTRAALPLVAGMRDSALGAHMTKQR